MLVDLVGAEPAKLTGQTLVTAAALNRELDEVRERGYALEKEEAVLGEGGIAAPIFDRHPEAVGAIGVAGPGERVLARGRERKLGTAVIEAARGISRDLGAPRWPAMQSRLPSLLLTALLDAADGRFCRRRRVGAVACRSAATDDGRGRVDGWGQDAAVCAGVGRSCRSSERVQLC